MTRTSIFYAYIQKNGTVEQKIELEKEQRQQSPHEAEKEIAFAHHLTETEYLEKNIMMTTGQWL